MHGPINVKSANNISEWQMGFNSAFKGLSVYTTTGNMKDNAHIFRLPITNLIN